MEGSIGRTSWGGERATPQRHVTVIFTKYFFKNKIFQSPCWQTQSEWNGTNPSTWSPKTIHNATLLSEPLSTKMVHHPKQTKKNIKNPLKTHEQPIENQPNIMEKPTKIHRKTQQKPSQMTQSTRTHVLLSSQFRDPKRRLPAGHRTRAAASWRSGPPKLEQLLCKSFFGSEKKQRKKEGKKRPQSASVYQFVLCLDKIWCLLWLMFFFGPEKNHTKNNSQQVFQTMAPVRVQNHWHTILLSNRTNMVPE